MDYRKAESKKRNLVNDGFTFIGIKHNKKSIQELKGQHKDKICRVVQIDDNWMGSKYELYVK